MPQKKSEAAKVRINKQIRSNKGQFIIDEDEYKPSDDYSEDSLDDEFINKRINKLNNFTLVWSNTNDIHKKTRKPYIRNSKATKYRKYSPSEDFTKAAKLTQPITNFFQIKILMMSWKILKITMKCLKIMKMIMEWRILKLVMKMMME